MTIYEGYTVKNRGFWALEVPPKRQNQIKTTRPYLYTNISVLPGQRCDRSQSCMRSIVYSAFDPRAVSSPCMFDRRRCIRLPCVRSHKMRSIANNCLRIPIAQELKRWSIGPARAMRETRVHVSMFDRDPCPRVQYAQSYQVRSISLSGVKTSTFLNFSHFEPQFAPRTYNTLKH